MDFFSDYKMYQPNMKGPNMPVSKAEICQLDAWSTSIQKFGASEAPIAELREDNQGHQFVIKFFDYEEDTMSKEMWEAEVKAHQRIQYYKPSNSNFADFYRYIECVENPEAKMIFMEALGNLSLKQYIRDEIVKFDYQIQIKWWISLLTTLARNVSFLENIGINHRDLHPSNIHIDSGEMIYGEIVNRRIKIFDFGLAVGKSLPTGKMFQDGWTVRNWNANFMGEFLTSEFRLGFDLHNFLAHFLTSDMFEGKVPLEILRDLIFPYLKNLNQMEIQELDDLQLDDPPYTEITFEGQTKIVPMNLRYDWFPTSGKAYHKTVLDYRK